MERSIQVSDRGEIARLFGTYDRNLKEIRKATGVEVTVRNGEIRVKGPRAGVERACEAFQRLKKIEDPGPEDVQAVFERPPERRRHPVPGDVFRRNVEVVPQSEGQRRYLQDIERNDIVFSIGPAGTGKTFIAVAKAVEALRTGKARRIVLVSGTLNFLALPLKNHLGADWLIATEIEERNGCLTGEIKGLHPRGENKRVLLMDLARRQNLDLTKSYAYGDHEEDIPLLGCVGRPGAVNPTRPLARTARERGWPVVYF